MKVITIGRGDENDVVVNDSHASRNHLQIILHDDGHYTLLDFGSTNGTYVNGQIISGEIPLDKNDVVRIGNTTIPWRLYFEEGGHDTLSQKDVPADEVAPTMTINQTMSINKGRNDFVSFWLWFMIIFNIIGAITQTINANYAIWAYATDDNAQRFFNMEHGVVDYYICAAWILVMLSLVNIAGAIMLLKCKKIGYWLFVGNAVACLTIMISFGVLGGFSTSVVSSIVVAIFEPIVLWTILQITKNGISCWKQLV